MTRKKLILMLVAAVLVVAATLATFSLYSPNWLDPQAPTGAASIPMPRLEPDTGPPSAAPVSAAPY